MRSLLSSLLVGLMLLPTWTLAQEQEGSGGQGGGVRGGAGMSVLSGKALGGASVLHVQAGWPGVSLTYLTGNSDRMDIGGKVSFLYAYEGITRLRNVPGLKVQGVLRLELLERERFNLGLRFSPGLFTYFFGNVNELGLALPVDLTAGFAITPKTMLNVGLDFPMFAVFGPNEAGLAVPALFGLGVEHLLDAQLALTANFRAGPSVPLTGHGIYGSWNDYICYDRRGNAYRCGGYYYHAPAAEVLVGVLLRM